MRNWTFCYFYSPYCCCRHLACAEWPIIFAIIYFGPWTVRTASREVRGYCQTVEICAMNNSIHGVPGSSDFPAGPPLGKMCRTCEKLLCSKEILQLWTFAPRTWRHNCTKKTLATHAQHLLAINKLSFMRDVRQPTAACRLPSVPHLPFYRHYFAMFMNETANFASQLVSNKLQSHSQAG